MEFTKSLNGAAENTLRSENNRLDMISSKGTDYIISPDGKTRQLNAPVLLTKVDNTKPFTFTAKVTPQFMATSDAGAIFVYANDSLWLKFAFWMEENMNTRIVTIRTNGTSDENNHSIITQESVHLKISSDATQIGFYYSMDNEIWNLVRLFKNDYPSELYVGLSSQSPMGEGNQTAFEELSLREVAVKDFRMGV